MFIATVYGDNATQDVTDQKGTRYELNDTPKDVRWFESNISPEVMWGLIPEDLKTYSVLGIHANTKNSGANQMTLNGTLGFYDEQLTICDELEIPAMIVVMAARGTSGSSNYSFNGIDPSSANKERMADLVKKHPSLKGFITSEHYWTGYAPGRDDAHHGKWLQFAAEHDKTLLIHDKIFDVSNYFSDSTFKNQALAHGDDHLILATKYTSAGDQHEAHSYAQGAWLTGVSHAYGGLIDTWSWAERRYGELMTNAKDSNASESGQYRYMSNAVVQYPGGVLAAFMMQMYLNGATVFNFEAPWVVCASEGKASTHMVDVIAPFFQWMVKNPAPSELEMRTITKNFFHGSRVSPGNIYPPKLDPETDDNPNSSGSDASYSTGRYGLIPFVSSNLFSATSDVENRLRALGGFSKAAGDKVESSASKYSKNDWDDTSDGYYEDPSLPVSKNSNSQGEPFAAIRNIGGCDTYYFYNTNIGGKVMTDEDYTQWARIPIGSEVECDIENDTCSATRFVEIGLTPHTAVIVRREANDKLRVWMCNARVNAETAPGFDGINHGSENLGWKDGRQGIDNWIAENLCIGGAHTATNQQKWRRNTKFQFEGCTDVVLERVAGQTDGVTSTVDCSGTEVTVDSNGWIEFTVTVR